MEAPKRKRRKYQAHHKRVDADQERPHSSSTFQKQRAAAPQESSPEVHHTRVDAEQERPHSSSTFQKQRAAAAQESSPERASPHRSPGEKKYTRCPLCNVYYKDIRQHLKKMHKVVNEDEINLVVSFSTGRFKGRLTCPECQMEDFVRLDKHFIACHPELTAQERKKKLKTSKREQVLKKLRQLRSSQTAIPLCTSLDLFDSERENQEGAQGEGWQDRNCRQCKIFKLQVKQQKHQIKSLKSRLKHYVEQEAKNQQKKTRKPDTSAVYGKIIDARDVALFIEKAKTALPRELENLKNEARQDDVAKVFGLLAGLIICQTGHRKGVVDNLTVEAVANPLQNNEGQYVIMVDDHKTASTFGQAQIPLYAEEYSFFSCLLELRPRLAGASSKWFFFNSKAGPYGRLLESFQECWKMLGLQGPSPTFSILRSSVSTFVGRQLSERQMLTVRRQMCHSQKIAEAFYEAENNLREAFEARQLTEIAVKKCLQDKQLHHTRVAADQERPHSSSTFQKQRAAAAQESSSEAHHTRVDADQERPHSSRRRTFLKQRAAAAQESSPEAHHKRVDAEQERPHSSRRTFLKQRAAAPQESSPEAHHKRVDADQERPHSSRRTFLKQRAAAPQESSPEVHHTRVAAEQERPHSSRRRTFQKQRAAAAQESSPEKYAPAEGDAPAPQPSAPRVRKKLNYFERKSLKSLLASRNRKPPKELANYVVQ